MTKHDRIDPTFEIMKISLLWTELFNFPKRGTNLAENRLESILCILRFSSSILISSSSILTSASSSILSRISGLVDDSATETDIDKDEETTLVTVMKGPRCGHDPDCDG